MAGYLAAYKTWTDADKQALKDLKVEVLEKVEPGVTVSLKEMILAVEPGEVTPAHMKGL
jgi:short-subunit dehydrogenase involved in D-alanine esterification of teichoic acids